MGDVRRFRAKSWRPHSRTTPSFFAQMVEWMHQGIKFVLKGHLHAKTSGRGIIMNHLGAESSPLILSRLPYGPEVSHTRKSGCLLESLERFLCFLCFLKTTFKLHRLRSTAARQRPLEVGSIACLPTPDSVDEGQEVKRCPGRGGDTGGSVCWSGSRFQFSAALRDVQRQTVKSVKSPKETEERLFISHFLELFATQA